MTLRSRVLIGLSLVLLVTIASAVVVIQSQRSQLYDQLDAELEGVISVLPPHRSIQPDAGDSREPIAPDLPIADFYVADMLRSGELMVLVDGMLLTDTPDLTQIDTSTGASVSATVDGVEGNTTFRVLSYQRPVSDVTALIATPTTDVDQTIRQLTLTFAAIIAIVGSIVALVGWWVIRLGIRPLSQMTATADAIAGGDRSQRAPERGDNTETAQLAAAFNVMLDQRDQAEDRLRHFVSDASHELRTPLTSIRGYLDLYAGGGFRGPGELDDAVRRMQEESTRMASLVEHLLQLARLDEGEPLDLTEVDIRRLIEDAASDGHARHPDRRVEVIGPDIGTTMVRADPVRLHQLLTGLVDNALVHAPDARVRIEASCHPNESVISVSDNGPGLESSDADQVFDRFYRGDRSRSRASGGSGLGLAIARSLAEAHGGALTLDTAPGEGCTFTVRLPACPGPAASA